VNGDDPIKSGLVSSLNRPKANVTGVSLYASALGPKKLELLRELVTPSGVIGVVANRGNSSSEAEPTTLRTPPSKFGNRCTLLVRTAKRNRLKPFADEHVTALLVATGVFFGDHRHRITPLIGVKRKWLGRG
jgi:putative ABC transport system substrate-binding protein